MGNKVEVAAQGSGEDSINRLVSAVERLEAALGNLATSNSPLEKMQAQMAAMQASMTTGFTELADLSKTLIDGLGIKQARAIQDNADRSVNAIEAAGLRLKRADASTWEQIQGGSASNVTKAFNQLAQGIPVEAVRQRMGEMATATAEAMDGELTTLKQFQANTKSLWETHYAAMAGATEAEMSLAASMNKDFNQNIVNQAHAQAIELKNVQQRRDTELYTDAAAAAARMVEIGQRRDMEIYTEASAAAARLAEIQQRRDMEEYAKAAAQANRMVELEQGRDLELHRMRAAAAADAESQAERQRALNASFLTAGPASQVRTAAQAQVYGQLGGDAAAKYGSEASAADALAAAQTRLALAEKAGGVAAAEAAAGHEILNDAMKNATGVFKGAAHEAGIYGLAHGQLIALLAGGALAAGLHHIAATGAEVEYELANLNALSGEMKPIDFDKFIGITSGTLTNLKDAAAGVAALAEAGFNQERAMAVLPDIMRLATLGNMTVAQSAEMAVESMHAFGKGDADISRIGDVLVAVGAKSNVSVHKLAEDMKSAATTGQLFNLSMEEITATVGTLAERGLTIQPLSSALNKLYEPSAKTAAVMKDWNLTVKDGEGNLKNYTQFMGELQSKVSEFRVPADALKQLGFSSRDIKAMEVMTQHWSDYKHLLDEANDANGKMFDAMISKEDTVEGAFKRLQSTVEGTFVKAFSEASPVIRQVEEDLMRVAGSKDVVDMLSNFAVAVARLTGLAIEHAKGIALMVAGYASLRIIGGVIASVQGLAIAYEASTAALIIKQRAEAAELVTLAAMTVEQRAAAVAAKELAAGSLLAGEGMTAAAAGARMVSSALGIVGLVVTAATVAYELFRDRLSEQEKLRVAAINTTDTTIDAYQREIERLKGVEEQLIRTGKAGKEAADMIAILHAQDRVTTAEAAMKAVADAPAGPGQLGLPGRFGSSAKNGQGVKNAAEEAANKELNDATASLAKLQAVQQEAAVIASNVQAIQSVQAAAAKIASFGSEPVKAIANTDAARLAATDANTRLATLRSETVTEQNLLEVKKQLAIVEKDIAATKREVSPVAKPDKSILAAGLSELQQKIELEKLDSKMELNSLAQQNKRGEVGDLNLINAQLQEKLDLSEQIKRVAKEQYDLVAASDKVSKAAALQKYTGVQNKAKKQKEVDTSAAEELRLNILDKYSDLELKAEAKTLTAKGDLVGAYLKTYEVQFGKTIANLIDDMERTSDPALAAQMGKYLLMLTREQNSGVDDAQFKQDKQAFDSAMASIQAAMADVKAKAAADGGLAGALGVAAAASEVRTHLLPALQSASNQLTLDANKSGAPALLAEATKAGTALSGVTKQLAKDAQPFGDAWGKVWKDVEGAAHSAWMSIGQGGVSALDRIAKVLKTGILDMIYQLTVKRWMVNIGDSISSSMGGGGDAGATLDAAGKVVSAGGTMSEVSALLTGTSTAMTIAGSSTAAGFLSGLGAASGAAGTGEAAMLASMATAGNLSAGATAGAALGSTSVGSAIGGGMASISTALAAIPVWGWAALAAGAAIYAFGGKGPEDHTRLNFTSNNTPGNISINERGNQGQSDSYVGANGKSALGTFGVSSTFWMDSGQPVVQDFIKTVSQTDDALAAFMTTAEKASVSSYLTGKVSIANTGHEGSNPNANGELDGVFKDRIHNIMEGLGAGLSSLTDSFQGTSAELATEVGKILQFRQALVDGGAAVFGLKVSLQDVAALKLPTEATSAALTRITGVFNVTNQVAQITGKTVEQMFGQLGLGSFKARDDLVQAAGGLTSLTTKVASYSANFITKSDQTAQNLAVVTRTMTDLGLGSVTTKAAFAKVVSGLDLVHNAADVKLFNSLMDVQQAFSDVASAAESAATGLQDQIDQLTMTRAALLEKERAALDPSNRALFDQLQFQKQLADAKTNVATAYDTEAAAIKSANDRLTTFGAGLRTFRDSLMLGSSSPLTPSQKYAEARNQFDSTLALAKTGDTKAQDNLQTVASAFIDASRVANASGGAFTTDFERVTGALTDMSVWADKQVDVGKASLDQLRLQVGALVDIKAAVLSLPEALKALMAQNLPDAPQRNTLTSLYKDVLGRTPDASGFDYWLARMKAGTTTDQVTAEMKSSPEYTASHSASAYDYTSGTANQTFVDMAAELRAVKAQLVQMQKDQAAQVAAQIEAAFAAQAAAAQKVADSNVAAAKEAAWADQNKATLA